MDVVDHDVELTLSLDPLSLAGSGTVRVVARAATSAVVLDARRLAVRTVHSGSRPLAYRQSEDRLCVLLPSPLAVGETRVLRMAWVVATDAKVPRANSDAIWAGYQTSAWLPTRQDPAQRATLRLRIRAPQELLVVASGRAVLATPAEQGVRVHSFELERPAPPFLFAFAAGSFTMDAREVDGVTLRAVGPRGVPLEPVQLQTSALLALYRELFGRPFPGDSYTQVFVPGEAAQEAAGMALLSASTLDDLRADPSDDWLIAHELAHQWFAWLVPCADFADFWLNEGFATFLVGVAKERREGRAAYDVERARWLARSDEVHAEGRDAPLALPPPSDRVRAAPSEAELPARGVTYMRGALVLDRLRRTLGEDVFWQGVRAYVRDQAGRPTRSDDLRRALERTSGQSLAGFFETWVYSPAWAF